MVRSKTDLVNNSQSYNIQPARVLLARQSLSKFLASTYSFFSPFQRIGFVLVECYGYTIGMRMFALRCNIEGVDFGERLKVALMSKRLFILFSSTILGSREICGKNLQ